MNFLAHLYIAEATNTSHAGALLGDHVRGQLDGTHGDWLETGIRLHRSVDTFTDGHAIVKGAFQRLTSPFRRYAGILVDIYFDHVLARHWTDWHSQPLARFTENATARIRAEWPDNPPFAVERLDDFPALLQSYRYPDGITRALAQVDQRLSRPSPLSRAWPCLQAMEGSLTADFQTFFPELLDFAERQTATGQTC